jgi:hypothetical protein
LGADRGRPGTRVNGAYSPWGMETCVSILKNYHALLRGCGRACNENNA